MKTTTCVFFSWGELDVHIIKWGHETFGPDFLCQTERDDESWRVIIQVPDWVTVGTEEYRALEAKFLPLVESLSHGATAPADCGWPFEKTGYVPEGELVYDLSLPQSDSETLLASLTKGELPAGTAWTESMATFRGVFFFSDKVLSE